jgi:hypothetical protein
MFFFLLQSCSPCCPGITRLECRQDPPYRSYRCRGSKPSDHPGCQTWLMARGNPRFLRLLFCLTASLTGLYDVFREKQPGRLAVALVSTVVVSSVLHHLQMAPRQCQQEMKAVGGEEMPIRRVSFAIYIFDDFARTNKEANSDTSERRRRWIPKGLEAWWKLPPTTAARRSRERWTMVERSYCIF